MKKSVLRRPSSFTVSLLLTAALPLLGACGPDLPADPGSGEDPGCSIPEDQLTDGGVGRDGIPSLDDPVLSRSGTPGAEYVDPDDRVIGLVLDGEAVAIPHRIGWWHEIVNLDHGDRKVAVTHCPLTGSSLAFDRGAADGAEFGVSGLLYLNNLVMFDRNPRESLWPQMERAARCGPRDGTPLEMVPVTEMTWEGWTSLHPETRIPAHRPKEGQNFANYGYPYGDYADPDNPDLLFPLSSLDPRRPPKERVLGIPPPGTLGTGGLALPFGELAEEGPVAAVQVVVSGRVRVVFWDRERGGAAAFHPRLDGDHLAFEVRDGSVVDLETGSRWTVTGEAVDGPLAGERLEPVAEAFVAFWFAWAAFQPDTQIWTAGP